MPTDPERSPAVLVTRGEERAPLRIRVPVGDDEVVAQVWRVDVGRVPLFLLDADRPENGAVARWISSRLYTGTRPTSTRQTWAMTCSEPTGTVTVIGWPSSPVTSAIGWRSGSVGTHDSCCQPEASMRWRK